MSDINMIDNLTEDTGGQKGKTVHGPPPRSLCHKKLRRMENEKSQYKHNKNNQLPMTLPKRKIRQQK